MILNCFDSLEDKPPIDSFSSISCRERAVLQPLPGIICGQGANETPTFAPAGTGEPFGPLTENSCGGGANEAPIVTLAGTVSPFGPLTASSGGRGANKSLIVRLHMNLRLEIDSEQLVNILFYSINSAPFDLIS